MAETAEKKSEAAAPPAGGAPAAPAGEKAAGKKGGLLAKTPVLLGGVMIIEAIVLFAGFKFIGGGGPKSAAGAELQDDAGRGDGHGGEHGDGHGGGGGAGGAGANKKTVEVPVLDFRAQNKREGRLVLYDVQIFIITKSEHEQSVRDTIKAREALIKDRVRTIIAQNDPEKLGGGSEPGLETLRRQVKYQLDEIVGEGMIDEVLVPRCIPFRTDY